MVLLFLHNHAGCTVTKFRRKTLRFVTHELFLPLGVVCLHKTRGNSREFCGFYRKLWQCGDESGLAGGARAFSLLGYMTWYGKCILQ